MWRRGRVRSPTSLHAKNGDAQNRLSWNPLRYEDPVARRGGDLRGARSSIAKGERDVVSGHSSPSVANLLISRLRHQMGGIPHGRGVSGPAPVTDGRAGPLAARHWAIRVPIRMPVRSSEAGSSRAACGGSHARPL